MDTNFKHMKLKKNIAISESGFIFDPSSGESFNMNPIGREILKMLQEGKSTTHVTTEILEKYDTDEATFERYYFDFIDMLKQYNLLEYEQN